MTTTLGDTNGARWRSVAARDAAADGTFVFAVRTTGIYCRPSCGARRPRRENVRFFDDAAAARAAGFRACLRCRPDAVAPSAGRVRLVQRLCRYIDDAERPPRLAELAAVAALSPFHVQRIFRATTGLTPRAYAAAVRARRVRSALRGGRTVTAAILDSGYESPSRFHADARERLGMSPRAFAAAGTGECIRFASSPCSLGTVLVAATARGVCAILLGDDADAVEAELREHFAHAELTAADGAFRSVLDQVVALVDGERPCLDLPLDVRGTAFQQRVWQAIRGIRAGETRSYAAIARSLGAPRAARAVAHACSENVLAVAIPCHRVVRGDGGLAGFRWDPARKRTLLERERRRDSD